MTPVEVCGICDIAGCHHIRERKADAGLSGTLPDATSALDALVERAQDDAKWMPACSGADTLVLCAAAITTLRAQLAEGRAKERQWIEKMVDAEARADRAEAALATAFGDGLRTAISVIASIGYGKNEDVDAGHEEALRAVEKYLTDWTSRSQLHDRTALDRHDAKTREKALREAADELRGQGYGAAVRTILALIEKPNAR